MSATFSESVLSNSISFRLKDGQGNVVAGSVVYDSADDTATFTPNAGAGLQYHLYCDRASTAQDVAGNIMTGPEQWSFTVPRARIDRRDSSEPSIAKGLTEQFTAIGTYADNSTQNLTSQVTWASATNSVATISGSGLAQSLATGTTDITAALGNVTSPIDTLTVIAAALVSIGVTPAGPSIAKGLTEQFTATGTYTDNSTQNLTSQVAWASATNSVATISGNGLAQSLATGTTNITATLGNVTSPTDTLTVIAAALVSIGVTPAGPSIAKGLTEQFTATGTYTDNSTQNLTSQVTWASATNSVATISGSGLAQSLATGTTNITATLGSVTSPTDTLTVTASVLSSIAVTSTGTGNVAGTLLYAIDELNSTGGSSNIINFSIPGSGVQTISPASRPANDHQAGHHRGDCQFRSSADSDPGRLGGNRCERPDVRQWLFGFEHPGPGDRGFCFRRN